ncbi:MAG: outer membrane beta-barrel protein [Burkholderiales bacterium]
MSKKHTFTSFATLWLALATPALAADPAPAPADAAGFYGGISLRDSGRDGDGIQFGHLTSVWSRFALPVTDDVGSRTLAYGGYRWANDLAVEAAVATIDRYSLQPLRNSGRRGVGLALASDGDVGSKAWNVDVYTTWEFRKSMSLYGRLGYAQSESSQPYTPSFVSDVRRSRDGVNYGLGVRYDMSPALGLRLEYARFGRLPGETAGVLPENDQLQLGVQFRF